MSKKKKATKSGSVIFDMYFGHLLDESKPKKPKKTKKKVIKEPRKMTDYEKHLVAIKLLKAKYLRDLDKLNAKFKEKQAKKKAKEEAKKKEA